MSWFAAYIALAWIIRVSMILVILRRPFAPGASVAWLGVVFLHPYIGLTLYMLVGETRLGPHRIERHRALMAHFRTASPNTAQDLQSLRAELPPASEPMVRQAEKISMMAVLGGNNVEFMDNCDTLVSRLVADIDQATSQVRLLYYIFACDRIGELVARAVISAAGRGVACRVLADGVASRAIFRRNGLAQRLRNAGVKVAAALPVAPLKRGLPRMDLRNHRKLAVIDGAVAYCGSHNLIDPSYGGRRGGPWIDVTGRFTGPIVREFGNVFAEDWAFETEEMLDVLVNDRVGQEPAFPMQVVPTGPTAPGESFRRVFLAAIQCAREKVILTTPYFVPDETTLVALMMAADRGVDVSLLLPANPDHFFTAAAGRAHFSRLLEAGVSIFLYPRGLLHAKTTTVDDTLAVFGSANLDVRSFNLNFELSVLLYGRDATAQLRGIQTQFLAESKRLDAAEWGRRSIVKQYADRAIALLSPLL